MRAIFFLLLLTLFSCSIKKESINKDKSFVCLAPSITENFVYLNATKHLVGVTKFAKYNEVKNITKVGGLYNPNIETIHKLNPSHILLLKEQVRLLDKSNRKSLITIQQNNLKEIDSTLKLIAYLLKKDSSKINFLSNFKKKNYPQKSAIIIVHIDHTNNNNTTYYTASTKSYYNDILKLFNLKNQFTGHAYSKCDIETLIKKSPNIIINVANSDLDNDILQNQLKNCKYISLSSNYASIPGPISVLKLYKALDSAYATIQ